MWLSPAGILAWKPLSWSLRTFLQYLRWSIWNIAVTLVRIYATCVANAVTLNKLSEQVRVAERPVIGRELVRIFVGCLDRLLPPPPPLLLLFFFFFLFFCGFSLYRYANRLVVRLNRTPSLFWRLLTLNSLWISLIPRSYVNYQLTL